jgi:hypothetical protein
METRNAKKKAKYADFSVLQPDSEDTIGDFKLFSAIKLKKDKEEDANITLGSLVQTIDSNEKMEVIAIKKSKSNTKSTTSSYQVVCQKEN